MKRRNRFGSQRMQSPRRGAPGFSGEQRKRGRKTRSFERLEERFCFSVSAALNLQTVSFSNGTPEGAAAILLRELQWAALQSASVGNVAANYTTHSLPNDPLFPIQWHLLNTGQVVTQPDIPPSLAMFGVAGEDANVVPAWNLGLTGEGIKIAVLDTGIQLSHPDLVANLDPTLRLNAINGTSNPNPILFDPDSSHGTAVAGVIAAVGNNGIGGTGVAPGATIVPIRLGGLTPADIANTNPAQFATAFQYVVQNDIDITNSSWGPNHQFNRLAIPLTPQEVQILRESVIFGRDGLGIINVFASGNNGGPAFSPGFPSAGNYDSSSYNPWVNSRFTIGVTAVDHDGQFANSDGTFTSYATAGPSVLIAAPSGSANASLNIADDTGQGSGIVTTDFVGDFGANAAPLPSGFDPDRDLLDDPNYTSRFGGTSAAAPIVSGVIALMLEANPNLSYRDVQEILVRSARQNALLETPESAVGITRSTWIVNQTDFFRDPDPWPFLFALPILANPTQAIFDPLADPFLSVNHFEVQPFLFTNGAGYTVSQGYGGQGEQIGYGHGVIDAGLAIEMAQKWHTLGQNLSPGTERTFSTFVFDPGIPLNLPAAERMSLENGGLLVPGGIGGDDGFIDYWEEFFEEVEFDDDTGLPDPESGPFSDDDPPTNTRGLQYLEFSVPPEQTINVEWVEVKISLTGDANPLESLRMTLESPSGTHSELGNWYVDVQHPAHSLQPGTSSAGSGWRIDPAGDFHTGDGNFVWTFSTNRHWGESTADAVVIDPATGEPVLGDTIVIDPVTGLPILAPGLPATRGWRLHIENWSTEDLGLDAVEIVWHGKPTQGVTAPNGTLIPAQRVQGFVGIDTNSDELFNYDRYIQTYIGADPLERRAEDVIRTLDLNQEPFAANILVEAFRINNGVEESDPIARFLTGADGNYFFDLVPGEYVIRVSDPLDRALLNDVQTPGGFQRHFQSEWRITADWFFTPDREDLTLDPARFGTPGEIFFGLSDADGDGIETQAPLPFLDAGAPIPSPVKNINFLLKQDILPQQVIVSGTVFADLSGNGKFDGDDVPVSGVMVYHDANRNGVRDAGEQTVVTSEDPFSPGQYTMTIFVDHADTYALGVVPPTVNWVPTNPSDGVLEIFAGPGGVLNNLNFHLLPEAGAIPGPPGEPGDILGVVFVDVNENGSRDIGDAGVSGFRVYLDANENGAFDAGEQFAITGSNGSYLLSNVAPGLHRIEIQIENEGTEDASWRLTVPTLGFREVNLGPGETLRALPFGVGNRANRDWGDLPSSYITRSGDGGAGGPSHIVVPGFRMGKTIDGEVNGTPTPGADGDDFVGDDEDGVTIITNSGSLQAGPNVLQFELVGVGGYLNGWIDINGDGNFDPGEQVLTNVDLNPGNRQVTVNLPADAATGPLAARFRWGEAGVGPTGPAGIGEVEDYFLPNSIVSSVVLAGDYDLSGTVDDDDRMLWRATFGSTSDLRADGNNDGVVDLADYIVWRNNLGATGGTGASSSGNMDHALFGLPVVAPSSSTIAAAGHVSHGRLASVPQGNSESMENVEAETSLLVGLPLFNAIAISSDDASADVIANAAVVEAAADSSLLLLDRALAELDGGSDSDADDAVWCNTDGDEDSVSDMALAAVLDDAWWGSL